MKITIDGREVEAREGQTVLEAAKGAGIDIPALCYHPDLEVKANCRMCLVEIKGMRGPQTACSTKIAEGMEIFTNTAAIRALRKTNLELIFSQHREECDDCVWLSGCQLLKLAKEYNVETARFKDRKSDWPVYKFGPIELDQTKCIDCRNCVEMCSRQANFLELNERGYKINVKPSSDPKHDCIYCGQCIVHCPVGAIEAEGEFEEIEKPLKDKSKTVVVQFAPSIRVSIGEMFGMEVGTNVTGKLVAALKKLGFDKVFDVNMAADLTTVEEAKELVSRVKKNLPLPMFTSCCPAWMRYIEFFRPDLIPNITTAKSPQNMLGSLIKTYWPQKQGINPHDIKVVSIMPCTAKKYDITKPEEKINGIAPIDCVLTTRELGRLLQKNGIDLKEMPEGKADDPFGVYTGAGTIFGATGGVTEAATRTAYWLITGKNLEKVECENVRGIVGLKKAVVTIGGVTLKVGIANGMENARIILDDLAKDPHTYDYVEVMACPGGCIGGGGQPLPVSDEIRKKRAAGLYSDDCAQKIRFAHESPAVKEIYDWFSGDEHKIHEVLHTHYTPKQKTLIKKTNK